ncbi:uncharacterized protein FA14DRAFT_128354 [Meira miltonrushii]|uniref:Arrestin-like N-terminal domain-containing protein n=1 Tax=Meira miltonrushii TaxID=1280837 RepID=A0A316V1A1_9BASI|nr:uncharacterized protein FA14DRAFT_128354 [Meira miltonrushii]PWN31330.1 hypothetical protein FA14DRAFT_128354 [Meira miltonrushii]
MINSIIHQPCEVSLHLYSSEIFLHPPRPNSELPGDDKTLRGLVEIRVPSERTIQAVKVTLQGHQTLAIPERIGDSPIIQTRYEDKVLLEKVVEIANESRPALSRSSSFKGKGKEKERNDGLLSSTTSSSEIIEVHGIHLEKGTHGFEFAFIIPASSPPFERGRYGRVRYTLTASAIGAGRGKANVTISREILIILNVNADGGPVPLDIQYHDYHEALGAMSVSLTSASLTVGGAATLSIYHPSPPFGLSVHVVRVFVEQTIELYSDVRQAWMKLPAEKLRIWERGFMPYKEANKQIDPSSTMEDCLWISSEDGLSPGRPGRSVIAGGYGVPTLAPYGSTMHPGTTGPLGTSMPGQGSTPSTPVDGYKLKAVMRLPDDNVIRPSTVRGSRAEIRVSHELGVEVFFSRKSVIDERPQSESKGKPKVQVFSMRRATIIPSCFATYDAIHLPPYSMESPLSSRPPTIRNPLTTHTPPQNATETELDHWKLTQTLRAALGGHANSGSGATPGNTNSTFGIHSTNPSQPGSAMGSRNTSPTRNHHSGPLGYFSSHHGPSLHALTPTNKPLVSSLGSANQMTTNSFPIVTTAPASGTTTPKTLPPNSPWAANNFPVRTSTSHESCQCGRSTEELMEAEQRLLEGVPTAPGIWIDAHDEGQLPPPWTPSRPSSPVLDSQDVSGWYRGNDGIREGGRHRGKVGESFENYQDQQSHTLPFTQHSQERHDSDDDGGLI